MRRTIFALALTVLIIFSSVYVEEALVSPSHIVTACAATTYTFTITGCPASVTAGQSFSGLVVTVYNSAGKVATGFSGSVYFTSTDSKATLPYTAQSKYTYTTGSKGDKGIHTFSGFNLVTAGSQTITVVGLTSSTTSSAITVNPAAAIEIQLSPSAVTLTAGSKQTYTATAIDTYGNSWSVTSSASWGITTGAGGSWSANTYTCAIAGTWTVTGSYTNVVGTATLTVNPASAVSISISPQSATIIAGSTETFTATATDGNGNYWSVTSSTTWSIAPSGGGSGTGGSLVQNIYTSHTAGLYTVKGTYGSLSASTSLSVIHGSVSSLIISPQQATITAGASQAFTATAVDNCGNIWDVTSSTVWTISLGAGGSWSGATYTSAKEGTFTVTGTYGSVSNTATLGVAYCLTFKITVSPSSSSLTAGTSESFTAEASDIYGNVWSITSESSWSISAEADGSWSGNTYTSYASGTWTVTCTYEGISGTAQITVNNGAPVKIVVGAQSNSIIAGSTTTLTSVAVDNCDNTWDVTNQTSWSISSAAGGSLTANVYTSAITGTWIVTGSYGQLSNTCSLTVSPAAPISILISPQISTLQAGNPQIFTAAAIDSFGNSWDVSSLTGWCISQGAGGQWVGNVYTAASANTWTVTGTYDGLTGRALLTVTHGSATLIISSPKASTIVAGTSQTFAITAYDGFGNSWNATASASFQVDPQASGSLNGDVYTACNAGTWIVTAICLGLTDTDSLTVTHSSPVSIEINSDSTSIVAGQNQTYTATASDIYGNVWDVTPSTIFSISSGAGGTWNNDNYFSEYAGDWVVTAEYSGLYASAYLTVNHGAAVSITTSPVIAVMASGSSEAFTASASDIYGNSWDVTYSVGWTVTGGAGGFWSDNIYTAGETGDWIVTAEFEGLIGIASLTVNHGTALSIQITPSSSSITAGQTQSFTANAHDSNGNEWDVTNQTIWSIDLEAGGSWNGNVYTSCNAGTWVITGTFDGASSTVSLTVTDGTAVSISIGPSSTSIVAGSQQAFTATAVDALGNTWNVTSSTAWIIDAGAKGSWSGNTYTSQLSGTWNVTGIFQNLSASVFLTVNNAPAISIQIAPSNLTMTAGTTETFAVTAFDAFGDSWDVTNSASLSASNIAAGAWSNSEFTAIKAGTWTVTATYANLQAITMVTVNPGQPTSIVISPQIQSISSGSSISFTTQAFDQYGNSWAVTSSTFWSISANAQGFWTNNVYSSAVAGNWVVTATLGNLENTTSLTVTHGSPVSITITPVNASMTTGSSETYTATASDASGNIWSVTNSASWMTSANAGGSWSENVYTPSNAGTWIITASLQGISSTALLTVTTSSSTEYSPADFYHTGTVNFEDLVYFITAYLNYGQYGIYNPACDFNHDGTINFQDLAIFLTYYLAAGQVAAQKSS